MEQRLWNNMIINLRIREHHKSHTRGHLMSARDNQTDLLKCMLPRIFFFTRSPSPHHSHPLTQHNKGNWGTTKITSCMEFSRNNLGTCHSFIWYPLFCYCTPPSDDNITLSVAQLRWYIPRRSNDIIPTFHSLTLTTSWLSRSEKGINSLTSRINISSTQP